MFIRTVNLENPFIQTDKDSKAVNNEKDNQFSSILKNALDQVNKLQIQSDEYKELLATGDIDNLHDITIAAEKANISLQLTLSIRNKLVEAYQEIMRMQV